MKNFIAPEELLSLWPNHDFKLFDVQYELGNPMGGKHLFLKSHIPRAVFADLESDLCGEITSQTGRHPLPPITQFISYLQSTGIEKYDDIIAYDNAGGGYAARLWWMLKTLGFSSVKVMEGGIQRWAKIGGVTEQGTPQYQIISSQLENLPHSWENGFMPIITAQTLKLAIERQEIVPIDSRNVERYLGLDSGPDFMAGRIPQSINLPWQENLNPDFSLKPLDSLIHLFESKLKSNSVFYCGSGVTACFNILLADELGFGQIPLYAGSWSEWIRKFPELVETGEK